MNEYESIVREADRFEILYKQANKTLLVPDHMVKNFKGILISNVLPEIQGKFIPDVQIDFFKDGRRTAFLMIANNATSPFGNFNSAGLNFGFRLTYEMGQAINDLHPSQE